MFVCLFGLMFCFIVVYCDENDCDKYYSDVFYCVKMQYGIVYSIGYIVKMNFSLFVQVIYEVEGEINKQL